MMKKIEEIDSLFDLSELTVGPIEEQKNALFLKICDVIDPCISPQKHLSKPLIEQRSFYYQEESKKNKLSQGDLELNPLCVGDKDFIPLKKIKNPERDYSQDLHESSNQVDEAVSQEEVFLDTFQKVLAQKFRVLRRMADNHEVKLNVDKVIDDVMTEVTRQVSDNFDNLKGRSFRNHLYVLLDLDESLSGSFKNNFVRWCEDFVKTLNRFKKMAPWMDMKAIASKVLTIKTEDFDYLWTEWPGKRASEKRLESLDEVSNKYTNDRVLGEYTSSLSSMENACKEDAMSETELEKLIFEFSLVSESKKKVKKLSDLPKRRRELLSNWKKLVNMGPKAIQRFLDSDEGKEAGLGRDEAARLKIRRGRDSARAIIRMKKKGWRNWTSEDWRWAGRQVSFISRMKGNPGLLYKDGKKTPKHLSLLVWGHNPLK